VLQEETVLANVTDNIAPRDKISDLHIQWSVLPLYVTVEVRDIHTARDENTLRELLNALEGSLNAIVDAVQNAWAKLERQRQASLHKRIANGEAGGVLVDLNTSSVTLKSDDLADEAVTTDSNYLIHLGARHVLGDHERTRDLHDSARRLVRHGD